MVRLLAVARQPAGAQAFSFNFSFANSTQSLLIACCLGLLFSSQSLAQTEAQQRDAQAQQEILQQLNLGETRPQLPGPDDSTPSFKVPKRVLPMVQIPDDDANADLLAGGTIDVRSFRFVGNEVISDELLAEVTRPFLGEGKSYGALLEARDRVTRAYIDAGFISSGAVLAEQTFDDGVIVLNVVEGRLTSVEIRSEGRLHDRYLTSRLIGDGSPLNINDVSERLRRLKTDPAVSRVTAELIPGTERGTSLLSIEVEETERWWASGETDNYASPSIGSYRGRAKAGYRNLSGWGDSTLLTYTGAEGLHNIVLDTGIPIRSDGTKLEFRVRQAWSEIVDSPGFSLDIEGRSQSYRVQLQRPLVESRSKKIGVFVNAEWKRSKTLLAGSLLSFSPGDDAGLSTVTVLRMGAHMLKLAPNRAYAGRVTFNFGLDALDATENSDAGRSEFFTWLIQLQGVEYLPWYGMRIHSRFDAQLARDRLLGLEKFSIGGHSTVRGYRENGMVRDQGFAASLELRIPLAKFGYLRRLELGVFGDTGYARDRGIDKRKDWLSSFGLGLHLEVTQHVRASIEWAGGLDSIAALTENDLQDHGLHFSLQVRFP